MRRLRRKFLLTIVSAIPAFCAPAPPSISLVANAEGEVPVIAPNTWVEIKGSALSKPNDSRTWQTPDFVNSQLPTSLDGVSVTVNGKNAYVYYISPGQIDVLTPPDALPASTQVVVTTTAGASPAFTAPAQALSPSFFVFNGGPYIAAEHSDYTYLGPASLSVPGYTFTPAKPGETVLLYANGFGATDTTPVSGSETQSGMLAPFPTVTIGGITAQVTFAGLVFPGEFQFNVVVPKNAPNGDNAVVVTYKGAEAAPAALLTVQGSGALPTSVTYYVSPNGNDLWSGTLAASNSQKTDGPFATFDHARAFVQSISKSGLTQVNVQFRAGTYFLTSTVEFTSADSGSTAMPIVYQNYPGETPVFSGGVRVVNWTSTGANTWKTALPASTRYFETLFYNGARRLRPRLGVSAASPLGTYYRIAATVYTPTASANCSVPIQNLGYECFDRFQYDPADPISGNWKNLVASTGNPCTQTAGNQAIAGDIEVLDFEQFSTSKLRISCIETASHIVYLSGPTDYSAANASQGGFIAGNRYLVDNVEDALTRPGQWFLDHSTTPWTLTYLANPGENPNTDTVMVPQVPQLLVSFNLQYVTFQGLMFEHDNYTVPPAGHKSSELEADIPAAVSFQNSQYVTFDSGVVTQISGTGLEFLNCLNAGSPTYCVSTSLTSATAHNVIENSAFFDIGVLGIRVGNPTGPAYNDSNVPQFTVVRNNVVEGYGRTIPASFGIGQGVGHDNLYTHNDVYDGYHCAISISYGGSDSAAPNGSGNSNNVISFNHVYNLLQGIMNDGGSIRIAAGNEAFTGADNKILNNKIHDVTDAGIMDSNGYGGNGIYLDDDSGLVDVENNLVYRVSGFDVYTPHGPTAVNQTNTIKNNILAYGRLGLVSVNNPYSYGVPAVLPQVFTVSNNLFYFDRSNASTPKFWAQGGCLYADGFAYTKFQQWNSNMYWRTDGSFAGDAKAFAIQPSPAANGPQAPCSGNTNTWTFFTFAGWQQTEGEDTQSVVQSPGFANPAYPADNYSLPNGSPGVGFVFFDPSQDGRSNPLLNPPAIPATFPTMNYNPATDY